MNRPITADRAAVLTRAEQRRLTAWTQVYIITQDSQRLFSPADARRILFTRWLIQKGWLTDETTAPDVACLS